MRVVIDNNLSRLYAQIAEGISQITKMSVATSSAAVNIDLINASGFAANDAVVVGEIGSDRSEIVYVQSVAGQTITVSPALARSYDSKSPVIRLDYNGVVFYEGGTIIGTKAITPDYCATLAKSVNTSLTYAARLINTLTNSMTAIESVWGYDRLLCTAEDMRMYDMGIYTHGMNLVAKMELARDEIRRKLLAQDYDIDDLDDPAELRYPAAILACAYTFKDMIKAKDDWPSMRAKSAEDDYRAKITSVLETLKDADGDINLFGQSRCER